MHVNGRSFDVQPDAYSFLLCAEYNFVLCLLCFAQEPEVKGGQKQKKDVPKKLPVPQMILAGAAAEVLGTTALLPFESTR